MLFENIRPFPIQMVNSAGQLVVLMPGQTFDFPEEIGKYYINVLKPVSPRDVFVEDIVSDYTTDADIVENNVSGELVDEPQTTDLEELSSIIEVSLEPSTKSKKGRPKTSDAKDRAEYKRNLRQEKKKIQETKQFLLNG